MQLAEAKQEIDEHRKDEGREKNFVFEAVELGEEYKKVNQWA